MQDSIQQEIESFYQHYADKEGITLTEARGRVSRIDMEQYERLAKKYVEAAHHGDRDTAFSQEANDQMRLYNLTMKVNRLEMLKARCGIRAMEGYRDTERLINENLEERAYSEYRRLAGILGNSVQFNENMVRAIVNASYQNATWSQRLWNHQASLSSQIGTQLASGILAGKSSTVLAREIQKLTGGSTYACQRLMRTELRRVQTEAALQSMTDNGVTEYKFMVENGVNPCDECLTLDGQVFKLSDMNVGKNAPPMHPQCHCATAPYVDEAKWQRWLDGPAQSGVPWAEFEGAGTRITNGIRKDLNAQSNIMHSKISNRAKSIRTEEQLRKISKSAIIKLKSIDEIQTHFMYHYDIEVQDFLGLDLLKTKTVLAGYDDFMVAFPEVRGFIKNIMFSPELGDNIMGTMDEFGFSKVGKSGLGDYGTGLHEAAHALDFILSSAFGETISEKVVLEAKNKLGKKYSKNIIQIIGLFDDPVEEAKILADPTEIFAYAMETKMGEVKNIIAEEVFNTLMRYYNVYNSRAY